jgi:hypoxanthine phosphoribosyltransferase
MRANQLDTLIDSKELVKISKRVAKQLNQDYKDQEVIVVGVLKGCLFFMADLLKRLEFDIAITFCQVKSYIGTVSSGTVKFLVEPDLDLHDKSCLIIEDIVDTGLTITELYEHLGVRGIKHIEVVTLLDKPSRRKVECHPKYIGKTIDDVFVVGYGLDYDEKLRQVPFVGVVREGEKDE